jgi:hypothetical protein
MPTLSKRSAVQEYIERRVGCVDPSLIYDYSDQLDALVFGLGDEEKLFDCLREDIQGYFERCTLTLLQALTDIEKGDRLWACVKLYYSVFYALRVELNLANIGVVRGRRYYSCNCKQGQKLKKYGGNQTGDHGRVIDLNRRYLDGIDVLLSAGLEGGNPYMWLKNLRDTVQYRLRRPPEVTGVDPFFPDDQLSIHEQVKIFLADGDPYYPFDPDYAALAIPIKRFQLTAMSAKAAQIPLDDAFDALAAAMVAKGGAPALLKPYLW